MKRLGYTVQGIDTAAPWKEASWGKRQCQRRLGRGSIVERINQDALDAIHQFRPGLLWADKQQYLRSETLKEVRKNGTKTIHFTPDPYFTLSWKRTPLMDEALQGFDGFVCCKRYEMSDYEALGKPVHYMPLGFCDEVHRPLHPPKTESWSSDVGFLGGWEPRRERYLSPLSEANRFNLKIRGGYWDFLEDGRWTLRRHLVLRQLAGEDSWRIHQNPSLAACLEGGEVYGDDYARALTGARIGLGFLRKVCPDQHTTRTFEIPACGSMLLADRTEEHREFFEEGKEADYFDSPEELLDKATFYTSNEGARDRIAQAGYQRCIDSKYAYIHRINEAMDWVEKELFH